MQQRNLHESTIYIDQFRATSLRVDDWLKDISEDGVDSFHVIIPTRCVFSPSHILSAVMKASRSFQRKENRARDRSIEVLRWLSGSRQVSTALKIMSIRPPENILIVSVPLDLPDKEPGIEQGKIDISSGLGLERSEGDVQWGGDDVRVVFPTLEKIDDDELELAVLEMVALTEL